MENRSVRKRYKVLSRLKLFLALSRSQHGLLDMTTPAFGALLWLGAFPPLHVTIIGIITVFAGYTAVYALNDVIDYRVDREKAKLVGGLHKPDNYLDAALVRHPMAQGLLSFREGLIWALGWSTVAMIGAYLLNPVCALIFFAGCALEAVYCLMLRISPFRAVISGGVKTTGAIAAVFAVDPSPSISYVVFLFLWLFFWEIGGQNIPNDWADIDEDRRLGARTILVRYGPESASFITLVTLILTLITKIALIYSSKIDYQLPFVVVTLIAGCALFMPPALRLYRSRESAHAMALFKRASYYPPSMLILIIIAILI